MNETPAAQAARLEMKRRALEYMERTMTADTPPSVVIRYEQLAREFVALKRSLRDLNRPGLEKANGNYEPPV